MYIPSVGSGLGEGVRNGVVIAADEATVAEGITTAKTNLNNKE